MRNIFPFLGCLIFIFPLLATSYTIVDHFPEENSNYNNMEERRGSWQDGNMFRVSKLRSFRPLKKSIIEPTEGVGEDAYIIMENNDLNNLEKRASKRLNFRATKRSSAEPDTRELQALKRMNFRSTKRADGELAPSTQTRLQNGGENLIRVQTRRLNNHFFRQQRA